ncbi:MAG: 23S rRNA (adenine(2503)-C(2))-methyltransferase RlmN [bacterium]|nr:23S rRNA (adenine(2503)-C(2))-methyltransferase RlmN [bacterium]
MQKKDIKSMTLSELEQELAALGEPRFRAKQIYEWMHGKQAERFSDMTNLPKTLRERLEEQYTYTSLTVEKRLTSAIDGTQKFLFGLSDKNVVESVWMRYQHGCSVCISSQVGCRMGCSFCASTLGGLVRNLTASEMLEQVYQIGRLTGERVSHVVVMGTGEPLDNYDALVRFLALISDEKGLHISQRNITVSTCGLTDRIRQLAGEKLQITLALSLHAPDQETRERLMPVAKRYDIHDAVKACEDYFACTGRRITYEYALIGGVNDTPENARALAELIGGQNCHVNLIPLNPVKERRWVRSKQDAIAAFRDCLEKRGIPVTLRREMGKDIEGACGQLRRSVTAQF